MFKGLWLEDWTAKRVEFMHQQTWRPIGLSSTITCQFLPEKRYLIYPNVTDEDEKGGKWELGQGRHSAWTQGSQEKMFGLGHRSQ
jgi:hypothetical protein